MAPNRRLLHFYLGSHPDHRGRLLAEILQQDDLWFESTHDFIQWLFPLREPSPVNPHAPTLDAATVAAFRADPRLQQQLRASLDRMLAFYGLAAQADGTLGKGANWERRKRDWFTRDTHNNLRLTRILKCLLALGLESEARALREALERLRGDPGCGIGAVAYRHWRGAFERPAG